jgi:hypothetical protein
MTPDERALVESEVRRVFDNSTFRASNGFVRAVDVYRREGRTQVSRTYPIIDAPGGQETASQTVFYCYYGATDADVQAYRYIVSSVQRDFYPARPGEYPAAWSPILSGTDWSSVVDLGFRDADGLRLHGLELDYSLPTGQNAGVHRPVQYWFDVETARLIERGAILEDEASTDKNWYRLTYDEPPPFDVPEELEKPTCVQDILATIAP